MKNTFFKGFTLALSLSVLSTSSLLAEVVNLDEVGNSCPSTEISYLSGLTTHTLMEGQASMDGAAGWDGDKYNFTPGRAGTVKINFTPPVAIDTGVKVDYSCAGGGFYRSEGVAGHQETEFHINEQQTVYINTWDWSTTGAGYIYDLTIEFTPDIDDGGEDTNTTEPIDDTNTTEPTDDTIGWDNITPYTGEITNIDLEGNNAVNLTGTGNSDKTRASYTYDGNDWNNTNFLAHWDMQTSDDYEIFFISKSSDDPTIDNYIGYVSKLPVLAGNTFDAATGYWSTDSGTLLKDWGRYIYNVISVDTTALTSVQGDLQVIATQTLGITLTSVENMFVNVYGDESKSLILDNIQLGETEPETPVNHAPVATAQTVTTIEGTDINIILTGTDEDADDSLIFAIETGPTNGTLTPITDDAELIYTPDANFSGVDSFTFFASDRDLNSTIKTITINVSATVVENYAPTATNIGVVIDENTAANIELLGADSDVDDNLTYTIVTAPINGTLSGDAPTMIYTPNDDYNGTDYFSYTVNDGELNSDIADVNITINNVEDISATVIPYNENSDIANMQTLGEIVSTDGIADNTQIEVSGTLGAGFDIDRYSFALKDITEADLEITVVDSEGTVIPSSTNIISGITDCDILVITIAGCDHTEDKDYTLTVKNP